jgi:hypothetical protein
VLPLTIQRARHLGFSLSLPALDVPTLGAALLYVLFFSCGLLQFTDPDYWWHLRTGHLIVDTGSVPHHDPFSFTAAGSRWIAHEWLSEVIIYRVENAVGYVGNVVLFALLALAALFIMHRLLLNMGLSPRLALALVACGGIMSLRYWTVRPLVFTWLLVAVFLHTLYTYHRDGRGRLWHLPLLMLLWANLHAGYVMGLVLLALWLVAMAAERLLWHERRDLRGPALTLVASFAATAVNPNGLALLAYPLTYLAPGNAILGLVSEWQSPDFHQLTHLPLALGIIVLVAVGALGNGRNLFRLGLSLVFTFFALQSSRHQPLFALMFMLVVGDALLERWAWARRRDQEPSASRGYPALNWSLLAVTVLVALAVVPQLPTAQVHEAANTDGTPAYPVEGAAFIREQYPEARMFNSFVWGGYLINALYPQQRVFFDGRLDMYGDALAKEYMDVVSIQSNWQDILDKYGVDLVIIERESALATVLRESPAWRSAFSADVEEVFVHSP